MPNNHLYLLCASPSELGPPTTASYTRWLGNRKFAIPSLIAYSCPHAPHTSLPSIMLVSINSECRSCPVFDNAACPFACACTPVSFPFPFSFSTMTVPGSDEIFAVAEVVASDSDDSSKASELGASSGRAGKPSCMMKMDQGYYYYHCCLFYFLRREKDGLHVFFIVIKVGHTSVQTVLNASHSSRGSIERKKREFGLVSTVSSSASRGCSGNASGSCLHVLRAQVRKLRVKIFMVLTYHGISKE